VFKEKSILYMIGLSPVNVVCDEEQTAFCDHTCNEHSECEENVDGNAQELERQSCSLLTTFISLLFLNESRELETIVPIRS
jgi:hypothetical protein